VSYGLKSFTLYNPTLPNRARKEASGGARSLFGRFLTGAVRRKTVDRRDGSPILSLTHSLTHLLTTQPTDIKK